MTNRRRLLQAAGATVGAAALSGAPLSATGDKRRKPDFLFLSAHVRDALRQGEGARQAADAAVALSRSAACCTTVQCRRCTMGRGGY